jgi:hypothetical protein
VVRLATLNWATSAAGPRCVANTTVQCNARPLPARTPPRDFSDRVSRLYRKWRGSPSRAGLRSPRTLIPSNRRPKFPGHPILRRKKPRWQKLLEVRPRPACPAGEAVRRLNRAVRAGIRTPAGRGGGDGGGVRMRAWVSFRTPSPAGQAGRGRWLQFSLPPWKKTVPCLDIGKMVRSGSIRWRFESSVNGPVRCW